MTRKTEKCGKFRNVHWRTWNTFDKIQHPFMIKILERSEIQGTYLNTVKAIYRKPVANIKLNGRKHEAIPLKLGIRQGCPLSLSTSTIQYLKSQPEQLDNKRISKGYKLERKKSKYHYLQMIQQSIQVSPINSTRELLNLINNFSTVAEYKINSNKAVAFLYIKDKLVRKKLGKQHPLQQSQVI